MKKVWIVEDEHDIANLIAHHVRKERFEAKVFNDGESFLDALKRDLPDLVVLDLMLPGIEGLDICRELRGNERTKALPIVMVTAKDTELDIVLGLELGADDYIIKPFSVRELTARIKAVLRRSEQPQDGKPIVVKDLSVDVQGFDVKIKDEPIDLTYAEFKILALLISKPGRVYNRQQIIEGIWDDYRVVTSKTVDVHITRLRKKLGDYGNLIQTVRGVGYKFEE